MNGSNKNWKTQFFIPKGCNLDIVNKVVIKGKEFLPVVHGEWLDKSEGYYWFGKCSVCGTNFSIDGWYSENMNYCPNCGARMDGSNASNALNALDNVQDGPIITPCCGCSDYDGYGGCKSKGGCARAKMERKEKEDETQWGLRNN